MSNPTLSGPVGLARLMKLVASKVGCTNTVFDVNRITKNKKKKKEAHRLEFILVSHLCVLRK